VQTQQLRSDRDIALRSQAERTRNDQHRDYANALRSAFLSWRAGDNVAARDYLSTAATIGRIGGQGPDFAYRYLSGLAATERLMIVCPAGAVTSLAVSADGTRLASGHANGTLALWDRTTGEKLSSVKAHDEAITHVAFALGGTRVFTVCPTSRTAETVFGWAVSPTGQITPAPEPHRVLGQAVTCLSVSPDGNVVYAGTARGELLERHLKGMGKDRTVSMVRNDSISVVVASRDGARILVGTGGGKVLRASTTPAPDDWERSYGDRVTALHDLGDGQRYIVGSRGGFHIPGIDGGIGLNTPSMVRWFADTKQALLVNGTRGRLLVRFGRWGELPTGDSGEVTAGVLSPDQKTLFTAGEDGVIRSWELPADLRDWGVSDVRNVTAVGVHPEGRWVNVADSKSLMWQFGTKDELTVPGKFVALRVLEEGGIEGTTLGVELRDRGVDVREPNALTAKARFTPPDDATATSVDLTPDGQTLAVGDDRGRVFVWSLASGAMLGRVDCGHRQPIRRVALSADGNTVAAPVADGVGIWSLADSKAIATIAVDDQTVFSFFRGGDRLVLAGRAGVVRVWNVVDRREELTLYGHVGRVTAVGVAPDNRTLVSGGATGDVKFWDLRTGLELVSIRRHSGPVTAVEFSSNGKLLVTAGAQVAIWGAGTE
jgi:WD40 repeat protein